MYEITRIQVSKPPTLGAITSYYFQGRSGEVSDWIDKPTAVPYVRKYPENV